MLLEVVPSIRPSASPSLSPSVSESASTSPSVSASVPLLSSGEFEELDTSPSVEVRSLKGCGWGRGVGAGGVGRLDSTQAYSQVF